MWKKTISLVTIIALASFASFADAADDNAAPDPATERTLTDTAGSRNEQASPATTRAEGVQEADRYAVLPDDWAEQPLLRPFAQETQPRFTLEPGADAVLLLEQASSAQLEELGASYTWYGGGLSYTPRWCWCCAVCCCR